jgi:hypothetical protein
MTRKLEEASDSALLESVLDHYARALVTSAPAARWLRSHGISNEVAVRFHVGFCDRSYGNSIPRSNCVEGRAIRERLSSLGLLRGSGHEVFRGCLTVPVCGPGGEVAGLYGIRISANLPAGTLRELWLGSSSGGLFNASSLGAPSHGTQRLVVVGSIPLALAAVSGGIEAVVAPGRAEGLSEADIEMITASCDHLVVVTRSRSDTVLTSALSGRVGSLSSVSSLPLRSLAGRVADALRLPLSAFAVESAGTKLDSAREDDQVGSRGAEEPVDVDDAEAVATTKAEDRAPEASGRTSSDEGEVRVESPARSWRIRGASRSKGYESLRANVMVSERRTGRFHIDTIDLYSSRQRGAFTALCAEELGASVSEIAAEIGKALLVTEEALDRSASQSVAEASAMSESERDEAMAMLCSADLSDQIVSDIAALGLVGEEDNALLIYLALLSRKSERPLSVIVQSSSAAGKSTLADVVCSLVPPEDTVSYSELTGQALYYLGSGDLAHKVLCVAEEEGAQKASYAIKLLVSAGRLAIASTGKDQETGRLVTRSYEVAGPVSVLMTTTDPVVDEELASRLVSLAVMESVTQTRAIHEAQRAAYSAEGLIAKSRREQILSRHHNAQRLVEALPVVIPMASELSYCDATTRSRRDHDKYLSLIAASALLHQHQRARKTIGDDSQLTYVEASWDDVALADRLAEGVIVRTSADLPPSTASLLSSLSEWAGNAPFTRRAAREALGLGDTQLKVHLARLVELEYVVAIRQARSVSYQLAWSAPSMRTEKPKGAGPPLRSGQKPMRSGSESIRSGVGRPVVGGRSGSGRGSGEELSSQVEVRKSSANAAAHVNHAYKAQGSDYSYVRRADAEQGERP